MHDDAERAVSAHEIMITAIADQLAGLRHVAVGARSPIPGSAAHLARIRSEGRLRISILGSRKHSPFVNGATELFDCAGQGRVDAFFLSGGQIDGGANINLVGVGDIAAYPRADARFPGSFGSAYLYFVVPRVILFTLEHTPRVLCRQVDFISAPGTSPPGIYRPGGPRALVTPKCVFSFDHRSGGFTLASTHPGVSVADVAAATGFAFEKPETVPVTPQPDAQTLAILRGDVAKAIAETYPAFSRRTWGVG